MCFLGAPSALPPWARPIFGYWLVVTCRLIALPSQRNLNNAFAYDLVPSPSVVAAALKAARRVNDFATAVRIFEGTILFFSPNSSRINRTTTCGPSIEETTRVLTTGYRHQVQGREQGPVRAVPGGAQDSA